MFNFKHTDTRLVSAYSPLSRNKKIYIEKNVFWKKMFGVRSRSTTSVDPTWRVRSRSGKNAPDLSQSNYSTQARSMILTFSSLLDIFNSYDLSDSPVIFLTFLWQPHGNSMMFSALPIIEHSNMRGLKFDNILYIWFALYTVCTYCLIS